MPRSAPRLVSFCLAILLLTGCQIFNNPPLQLVALTPTASPTPAGVATLTPTPMSIVGAPSASPTLPFLTPGAGTLIPFIPDLNGVWTDNGRPIVIVQNGFSASSAYIEERECDHGDDTGAVTPFRDDFNVTLALVEGVWTLSGQVTICAFGYGDPSMNGVHFTQMKGVLSADFNSITGDWYHTADQMWVLDGLFIVRQFENGAPVPTPTGFSFPTAVP